MDTLTSTNTVTPRPTTNQHEPPAAPPAIPAHYFRWKGIFDRGVALVLLIAAAPLALLLVILVRLTSPGPGLYRQQRVGRGGHRFNLYKIRTMRHRAESDTGPVWSTESDPRVTRVGGVLRSLHLDELPQLWNVVKGDMALIGPRPERPEFTQFLAEKVPNYLDRLAVHPGITGLAQIRLSADTDIESVRRKLVLDRYYIQSATWWMDNRIILCTALKMLGLPTRWLVRRIFLKMPAPPDPDPTVADTATSSQAAN